MQCSVFNTGIPGDNTRHLLEILPGDLKRFCPDLAVVSVGANDVVNPKMLVPFAETMANLASLRDMLAVSGVELILLTPPRICFEEFSLKYPFCKPMLEDGLEAEYRKLARAIRNFAEASRIRCVDLFNVFDAVGRVGTSEDSLVRNKANSGAHDGVHPTPAGHTLIGAMLFQMIRSEKLPCSRVLCAGDSITHGYPLLGMGTVDGDNYASALRRLLESIPE